MYIFRESGNLDEAMNVIRQIRNRAGIIPGNSNNYGVQANDKESMREIYFKERAVEFAFEGKRWWDIRRHRRFDVLNNLNLKKRTGLKIKLKEGEYAPSGIDNINDFYNNFTHEVVQVDVFGFDLKEEYYFYGIPKIHLDQNPNLEQTNGWAGGSFDPIL